MILSRALYHQKILTLFNRTSASHTPSNMQPSITSFFKVKQSNDKVENVENEQESDIEIERPTSKSSEKDSQSSGEQERATPTVKRALDSDDDDEDIKTTGSKKRQMLSSAESTPVKKSSPVKVSTPVKESISELASSGDAPKKDDHASIKSPAPAARPLFAQSPLLNVQALINAKISSGSHALHENIGVTWFKALQPEFDKPYFKNLSKFVKEQRAAHTVYPPEDKVFSWTHHHTIRDTRVVILGQDPYPGVNQAHGLSFSVQKGISVPKSLLNIYTELESDIEGFKRPPHGELVGWAKQGVLLLNSCLTVNAGAPNSHQGKGWEKLTDAVISWISKNANHKVVFLLWGRFAQKKSSLIDKRHKILNAAHPSPLSAYNGFMGCKHFSQTNAFLKSQKLPEIDWAAL